MDYKVVIQEQIRELQRIQDQNMKDVDTVRKTENAVKIADCIKNLCEFARGL